MAGNRFGTLVTVTTFGESHGPAYGGVVDGCPPGLELTAADLQRELDRAHVARPVRRDRDVHRTPFVLGRPSTSRTTAVRRARPTAKSPPFFCL